MKDYIDILFFYIRAKRNIILALAGAYLIFLMVFALYSLPFESINYTFVLICAFIFIIGVVDFRSFYKKHNFLKRLKTGIMIADYKLPVSKELIEKDYQELIQIIDKNRLDIVNEKDKSYSEMIDYYTIWAHQIKTPIAAMRLLLQSEKSNLHMELLDQLFKVEQYVEMVLQYLRIESISSDLVFRRYPLDSIIKQAIKKYSSTFIRKKIKLNYEEIHIDILTDEKWLVFVIEQILSNALKYTNKGQISIYMDHQLPQTLIIEDTGIGIAEEDLPRIFEKGYTGFNGRSDKKSTGIGLYLCKRILNKLSHTINIESFIDKGTKVKIGLDAIDMLIE